MSRAKRIFKLIQRRVPGLVLCKDILVVVPTENILRGFFIENTSERDRVYLWRVVSPLFYPHKSVILNYSKRIPSKKIHIDRNDSVGAVEEIHAYIIDNIEYCRNIKKYSDFLKNIEWRIGSKDFTFNIDLALTYYRVGNVRQSFDLIRQLYSEIIQLTDARRDYLEPRITRLVNEIDANPFGLTPLLDEWNEAAIAALDIEKSRYLSVVSERDTLEALI